MSPISQRARSSRVRPAKAGDADRERGDRAEPPTLARPPLAGPLARYRGRVLLVTTTFNRDWADCLDLAATPEEFSQVVRLRLETGLPTDQSSSRARLTAESWADKVEVFAELVLGPAQSPTSAACPS